MNGQEYAKQYVYLTLMDNMDELEILGDQIKNLPSNEWVNFIGGLAGCFGAISDYCKGNPYLRGKLKEVAELVIK